MDQAQQQPSQQQPPQQHPQQQPRSSVIAFIGADGAEGTDKLRDTAGSVLFLRSGQGWQCYTRLMGNCCRFVTTLVSTVTIFFYL